MRSGKVIVIVLLLTLSTLSVSTLNVSATPSWLKPGVYIEYRIPKGSSADEKAMCISRRDLVAAGILYRFVLEIKVKNKTIPVIQYTDIPSKETLIKYFKETEERKLIEFIKKLPYTPMYVRGSLITNHTRFEENIEKALREGKLSPSTTSDEEGAHCFSTIKYYIVNGAYSWKCIGFKEGKVEFEVRFNAWVDLGAYYPEDKRYRHIDKTFRVLVDPTTRRVYTSKGEYIGITPLWITKLKTNNRVVLCALYNTKIYGTVGYLTVERTPIGYLKGYYMTNISGLIPLPVGMTYEEKTGVLVSASFYMDPVLKHFMGIQLIKTPKKPITLSKVEGIDIDDHGPLATITIFLYNNPVFMMIVAMGALAAVVVLFIVRIPNYVRDEK